jgi:hypothetical protein
MAKSKAEIQKLLDSILAELNEDSIRIFEMQITSDSQFQESVARARKKLGIKIPTQKEKGRNERELNADVNFGDYQADDKLVNSKQFLSSVDKVILETKLPEIWRDYIAAYISGKSLSKDDLKIYKNEHLIVENADEDSIVIRIRKGIRYEEYVKAWDALAFHLGKGRRRNTVRDNAIRDLQMYHSFYFRGLPYKEISKLYLDTDVEWGVDTVKKAIKRQKKLFDEGIDLAK